MIPSNMRVKNPSPHKYAFKPTRLINMTKAILNLASNRCSNESPAM
jgi:hypothetical protein